MSLESYDQFLFLMRASNELDAAFDGAGEELQRVLPRDTRLEQVFGKAGDVLGKASYFAYAVLIKALGLETRKGPFETPIGTSQVLDCTQIEEIDVSYDDTLGFSDRYGVDMALREAGKVDEWATMLLNADGKPAIRRGHLQGSLVRSVGYLEGRIAGLHSTFSGIAEAQIVEAIRSGGTSITDIAQIGGHLGKGEYAAIGFHKGTGRGELYIRGEQFPVNIRESAREVA